MEAPKPKGFGEFDNLMRKLVKVPAERVGEFMTVQQLIEALQSYPQDFPVILSRDVEGNGFSPMPNERGITMEKYEADTAWSGSIGESDKDSDANVVVLWPTN